MESLPVVLTMAALMGVYQGLNPPMGWLFAVGRGLEHQSWRAVLGGTWSLAYGHFLAMALVLLPGAVLLALLLPAPMGLHPLIGIVLIAFGAFKLLRRRHPGFLARIPPSRPVRWSFAMSLVHCGSPVMMLAPLVSLVSLGSAFMSGSAGRVAHDGGLALLLAGAMAAPLFVTASLVAAVVYRRHGLRALTRYWFDLDLGWAAMFVAMGAMGILMPGNMTMALALCR